MRQCFFIRNFFMSIRVDERTIEVASDEKTLAAQIADLKWMELEIIDSQSLTKPF